MIQSCFKWYRCSSSLECSYLKPTMVSLQLRGKTSPICICNCLMHETHTFMFCGNAAETGFTSLVLALYDLLASQIFTKSQMHQLRPLGMISGVGCETLTSAHCLVPHFFGFSTIQQTCCSRTGPSEAPVQQFQHLPTDYIALVSSAKAPFKFL